MSALLLEQGENPVAFYHSEAFNRNSKDTGIHPKDHKTYPGHSGIIISKSV